MPSNIEIWDADLRGFEGHEQKGKRPGIIWKDLDHVGLAVIIPLTTKMERTKLPYTHLISAGLNGLLEDSVALLYQMKSIDKKRLIKKIGKLDKEDIEAISGLLKDMLKL